MQRARTAFFNGDPGAYEPWQKAKAQSEALEGAIERAAASLKGLEQVDGGIGVVGFCAGGSLALWSATVATDITSACAFYPGGYTDRLAPDWSAYADKAAMLHCAEGDGTSAAPHIQAVIRGIEDAGGKVTIYDYAGTDHAFFNDDRPEHFHRDAATVAWARSLDFLRTTL